MAETEAYQDPSRDNRAGWRRLGVFWLTVLLLMAIGTGVVEFLGAPGGQAAGSGNPSARSVNAPAQIPGAEQTKIILTARPAPVPPLSVGRDTPGPVSDPDPALLEPVASADKDHLPRVATDGRTAMRVYAAGFDRSSRRPRVGLLLAGIGMNEAESDAAIRALPGAGSRAVAPYAAHTIRWLARFPREH